MDIAMNSIKFINHSSVLINDNNNFILTDPWFEKPAFGSWLPTPPCSVHPAYLVALSNTVENFILAISHGHDDHLDDELLSLFPKNLNVVIPRYRSKGLVKRLNKIGFTNIHEVDETG
jgi:L-ascorbate metabolism protein UlaG (beta-lactamase superfamily)